MPKFLITATAIAKVRGTLEVEANSAEEALEKARGGGSEYESKIWLEGHWVTQWDEVEGIDITSVEGGGGFAKLLGGAEDATKL